MQLFSELVGDLLFDGGGKVVPKEQPIGVVGIVRDHGVGVRKTRADVEMKSPLHPRIIRCNVKVLGDGVVKIR